MNNENSRSSMIEQFERAEGVASALELINEDAARKIRAANFVRDLEEVQRGNKEIPLDATKFPEILTKRELKRIASQRNQKVIEGK